MDEDIDAVVHFIAPVEPGPYVSHWRLMLPSGQMFGEPMWVFIQVRCSVKCSHVIVLFAWYRYSPFCFILCIV